MKVEVIISERQEGTRGGWLDAEELPEK